MDNSTSKQVLIKKILIAVAILAAAVIAGWYYYQKSNEVKVEREIKSEMTGLEIAQKLDIFAQKLETNTPGTYFDSRICKKGDGCKKSKLKNRGGWGMPWAYGVLYEAAGEERYLNLAKSSLEQNIQYFCFDRPDKHNCFYMSGAVTDLARKGFIDEQKTQEYIQIVKPHVDAHVELIEKLKDGKESPDFLTATDDFLHAEFFIYFYGFTREEKYRDAAEKLMELGSKKLAKEKNKPMFGSCQEIFTLTYLSMVANDPDSLNKAKKLVVDYRVQDKAETIGSGWDMMECMAAYWALYGATKDEIYKAGFAELSRYLFATFMDHPKNNFYTGNFAILEDGGWHETNTKHRALNLIYMALFASMKDMVFTLQ